MSTSFSIFWSPKAKETYLNALLFIMEKWTVKEAKILEGLTNDLLDRLSKNSKLCPKSKVKSVRKCVISSQTSLVYRVNRKSIELLVFIDNRSQHSY